MARSAGIIGERYTPEQVITRYFKDATATEHPAHRFVTKDTGYGDGYVLNDAISVATFNEGVTLEKVTTTSTDLEKPVAVQTAGIAMVEMEGSFTYGDQVQCETNTGKGAVGSSTGYVEGFVLKSGNDGDIAPVLLNRYYHA